MELIREGVKSIQVDNHKVILLPEKALFLESERALILADPHLGKTAHFRKSGIPIPDGIDQTNYQVLQALLASYPVQTVYILGDLFHSHENQEWQVFIQWLRNYPQKQFCLIQGNHDILPERAYQEAGLSVFSQVTQLGPFLLSHKPLKEFDTDLINLAGHIHPGIQLRGKGRQSLKLPCFYWTINQMILPAFGHFTGTSPLKIESGDRVFPVADDQVFEV